VSESAYVFSAAQNDATVDAVVTKSGKAFHARVAMSGNEHSTSVAHSVVVVYQYTYIISCKLYSVNEY